MAGAGSRFKPIYGDLPKFLIEVGGKTLFHHSVSSLPLEIIDYFVFVCRESDRNTGIKKMIKNTLSQDFKIIYLNSVLPGQALSAQAAMHLIDPSSELIIYNIDTKFFSKTISENLTFNYDHSSYIGAFIDNSDASHWSFAKVRNNLVIKTAEKVKISNYALTGFYHFKSAMQFFDGVDWLISERLMINFEYYIAPIYNKLIADGNNVRLDMVSRIFPLGTPEEVAKFETIIL